MLSTAGGGVMPVALRGGVQVMQMHKEGVDISKMLEEPQRRMLLRKELDKRLNDGKGDVHSAAAACSSSSSMQRRRQQQQQRPAAVAAAAAAAAVGVRRLAEAAGTRRVCLRAHADSFSGGGSRHLCGPEHAGPLYVLHCVVRVS